MIKNTLNDSRFIPNDKEELTAIEMIYKLIKSNNLNYENMEGLEISLHDKISKREMKEERKLDEKANFTGSWHGIEHPVYTEEGQPGVLLEHDKQINKLNSLVNSNTTFNIAEYGFSDGDNITQAIIDINSKVKDGDTLIIPNGTYITNSPLKLVKNMTLKGASTRESIIKAENCNLLELNGESILKPNTKGHLQGINVSDISLYCQDQAFHIIQASACSHVTFTNVYLFGTTKSAVDGVEFFDVRWINCWFYWCGDYEGNYPVLNFRNTQGYEYNNNHFFYGCMFESNRGQILKIDAEYNTEFKFVSCKFENTESSVIQFYLRKCGGVIFNDCMFSAEGRNKVKYETIFSIEECWGITINGTLYKWDDINGNRPNYAIPKSLMNVTNCRSYKIDLVLYNNRVRLQNDNAAYIQVWNPANDGSYINLIKHSGDGRSSTDVSITNKTENNMVVNHSNEPFIGVESHGTAWQMGRVVQTSDGTKYKLIHYDKQGNEHEIYNMEKSKFTHNADTFFTKGCYLGRYSGSQPWGYGGCIYYDTDNNQYKLYVDGQGWKTLSLV